MGDTSKYKEEKQIALGILAHVDAGKTTLSEGILYLTGQIRKLGRVDHGDAFLDTYTLESSRGIKRMPFSIIMNWKRSGASQSFPSRRCFGSEV